MEKISKRHIKAWERFNEDLRAFALESEGTRDAIAILYEDAFTTREVSNFMMLADGTLLWIEKVIKKKSRCLTKMMQESGLSFGKLVSEEPRGIGKWMLSSLTDYRMEKWKILTKKIDSYE